MTKRILTVLLASLLIAVSILGVSASALSGANADFSIPGSSGNVTMTSTEILEQYLGESLGMSEREFFESIAGGRIDTLEIAYSEIINTNKAQIEYENGSLNIRARKYEYTGVNGKSFVWIPDKAYVKDTAVTLENDGDVYVGKIVSPEPISDDIVKISYKAEISISASDMNEILNLYRNSAEYALDKANYDAYLVEKKLYDDAKAKYEKYLADMEEYERLKDSYILSADKLATAKSDMCILHPLPRVNEISVAVDKDPRACYFKQVLNGKLMRMALIMKLLDEAAKDPSPVCDEQPAVAFDGCHCKNPRCITTTEQELPHLFKLTDAAQETYRCIYCESKLIR